MDLDGDPDIVAVGFGWPYIKIFWNDGGDPVTWREEEILAAIVAPLVVSAADLDGDGDMDVVATSNNWHRVIWWQNDGGPVADWPKADVAGDFINAWPLATVDLDGNGSIDVVSGASGATEVAWWKLADFADAGSLESRVLEIPEDLATVRCSVDAELPAGTGVTIQLRAGSSEDALGEWIEAPVDRPVTIWTRGPAYLQYRLILETANPTVSPSVRGVTVEWTSGPPARQAPSARVAP
jgi:hypothetical protein